MNNNWFASPTSAEVDGLIESHMTRQEIFIWLYLKTRTFNKDKNPYPSLETMSNDLKILVRHICSTITKMETKGYIKRKKKGIGREYELIIPNIKERINRWIYYKDGDPKLFKPKITWYELNKLFNSDVSLGAIKIYLLSTCTNFQFRGDKFFKSLHYKYINKQRIEKYVKELELNKLLEVETILNFNYLFKPKDIERGIEDDWQNLELGPIVELAKSGIRTHSRLAKSGNMTGKNGKCDWQNREIKNSFSEEILRKEISSIQDTNTGLPMTEERKKYIDNLRNKKLCVNT